MKRINLYAHLINVFLTLSPTFILYDKADKYASKIFAEYYS